MNSIVLRFIRVNKDYRNDKLCRLLITYVNIHHNEYLLYTKNPALIHIYNNSKIQYDVISDLSNQKVNRIHYKKQ